MSNQFTLKIGQQVKVHAYKHDGKLYREWNNYIVKKLSNDYIILEGFNVFVRESKGDFWKHKGITYWYLSKNDWFNCVNFFSSSEKEWYCNLASPYYYDGEVIKFIDYDIDIKLAPTGKYQIRDINEYNKNKDIYNYSDKLCKTIEHYKEVLISDIKNKRNVFAADFIK